MKITEIRELTTDELRAKIDNLHKELFEARFKLATHQLEDTAMFRRLRHQIAQFKTVLAEKERASAGEKIHA